jgi:coiled-coil domain-containing protein 55
MATPPAKLSFSFGKPGPKPTNSTKSFGNLKPKPTSAASAFSFGDDDEEDQLGVLKQPLAGPSKVTPKNNGLIKQNASLGRQAKKIQEEAMKLDQTVFEYDEVWDGMQNAREQVKQAKDAETAEHKVSTVVFLSLEILPTQTINHSPNIWNRFYNLPLRGSWTV